MKTAISIPDDLFEQVTRCAAALGMSRSAFFARAAQHLVDDLAKQSLTEQVNAVADLMNEDEATRDAVEYNRRRLAEDAEDW